MLKLGLCAFIASLFVVACGGEEGADLSLGDRLTQEASDASPAPTLGAGPTGASATAAPTVVPTPDASTVLQVRTLAQYTLGPEDLPAGYEARSQQIAFKRDVVAAQISIPELARYFQDSDLLGSAAGLYANPGPPQTAISSVIYLFSTPEGARGLVDAASDIESADYLSAIESQLLPAPQVGEAATMTRFRLLQGRSLEVTWSQGVLAGQVIVRSDEDAEAPNAVEEAVRLAALQAQQMAEFLPQ